MQPAGSGHCADQLRADAVGGLGEVTDAGAGVLGDPLGQSQQCASLRVLSSRIAQQHSRAFRVEQRLGDGSGFGARRGRQRRGNTLPRGHGRRHVGQRLQPAARRGDQAAAHGHGPVVVQRMQAVHHRTLAYCLAQPLREQRMVLAQE
jgi:hypothetical protein